MIGKTQNFDSKVFRILCKEDAKIHFQPNCLQDVGPTFSIHSLQILILDFYSKGVLCKRGIPPSSACAVVCVCLAFVPDLYLSLSLTSRLMRLLNRGSQR